MLLNKIKNLKELELVTIGDRDYVLYNKVLKPREILITSSQEQTQKTFGFKWKKENTFDSPENLSRMKNWLLKRYGDPKNWLSKIESDHSVILDAGCGAGMSGFEYWGCVSDNIEYVGIDISEAIDVAQKRSLEKGFRNGIFIQESIGNLPFKEPLFEIIFSEGVLHHTDNTEETFNYLCQFLKPKGLFMFYVYRKKAPVREFTDDYIRGKLQNISPEAGWNNLYSLTKLGIELGKLNLEIDIPEDVEVLEIPAGKINLQRLFYWYIFKAFYDPNLSFDEMHHINFDWYAPKNAHRHTVNEVKDWCCNNGFEIQHLNEEEAGITCVARKQ